MFVFNLDIIPAPSKQGGHEAVRKRTGGVTALKAVNARPAAADAASRLALRAAKWYGPTRSARGHGHPVALRSLRSLRA